MQNELNDVRESDVRFVLPSRLFLPPPLSLSLSLPIEKTRNREPEERRAGKWFELCRIMGMLRDQQRPSLPPATLPRDVVAF